MTQDFGATLLRWRRAAGLTQPQAGKLLGATRWTILHWEAGHFEPREKRMAEVVDFIHRWYAKRKREGKRRARPTV